MTSPDAIEPTRSSGAGGPSGPKTHLALVLYAGDYAAADRRRAAGEADRYRHHTYALECLHSLVAGGTAVTVIQVHSENRYDQQDVGGPRFVGLGGVTPPQAAAEVRRLIEHEGVSHAMIRFPDPHILEAVAESSARGAAVLADSFVGGVRGLRASLRNRRLGRALRAMDLVANHQLNASRDVAATFDLPSSRVVPWDWPLDLLDRAAGAKDGRRRPEELRIVYVGTIVDSKGVFDLVRAVGRARDRYGLPVRLDVAGGGNLDQLRREVARAGLDHDVRVLGRVGGDDVLDLMEAAAFVCVPSRHDYPEGLPLTLYEAMAVGTPLIASDHPMFRRIARDDVNAFVFRAGSVRHLAATIKRAWEDRAGYQRVSATAAGTYADLDGPILWGDLVRRWVSPDARDRDVLQARSLASFDG